MEKANRKLGTIDVWVKETRTFTAQVKANTLEQALEMARKMSIDQLDDAPGELISSDHEITAVTI